MEFILTLKLGDFFNFHWFIHSKQSSLFPNAKNGKKS